MKARTRRWWRRWRWPVVAAVLISVALGLAWMRIGGSRPEVWTLFLVDVSSSTWSASPSDPTSAIRTGYRDSFEKVLNLDLREKSVFALDVIDSNPLAHGQLTPYEVPSCDGLSFLDCQSARSQARSEFLRRFESLVQTQQFGTDIRGGLFLASRFFASDTSGTCHRLVIFSDMLLRQPGLSFADPATWDNYSLQEMIDEVGQPPLLSGVDVYLVGLGRNGAGDFTNSVDMQTFWEAYLTQGGARVRSTLGTLPINYPFPCTQSR